MELLLDFLNMKKWDKAAFFSICNNFVLSDNLPSMVFEPNVAQDIVQEFSFSYYTGPVMFPEFVQYGTSPPPAFPIFKKWHDTGIHYSRDLGFVRFEVWAFDDVQERLDKRSDDEKQYIEDIEFPNDDLFVYLSELSTYFRWILEQTRENGPQLSSLRYFFKLFPTFFKIESNPWTPVISNDRHKPIALFERELGYSYLAPFLNGTGEAYKRIRTCSNPECGKLFVYNRPKQNFCNNDCRYDFHNRVKVQSGYMAEYQRKGREENPATYYRK